MTWINPSDIRDRWLSDQALPDDAKLETLISDMEDILKSSVPGLETKIEAGEIPIGRLIRIGYQGISRKLLNPTGLRSSMQVAGAYSVQNTYGGNEPGSLYLTEDELKELRGKIKKRVRSLTIVGD